jgi:hypothetical protein
VGHRGVQAIVLRAVPRHMSHDQAEVAEAVVVGAVALAPAPVGAGFNLAGNWCVGAAAGAAPAPVGIVVVELADPRA